jgi:hypothetical protein
MALQSCPWEERRVPVAMSVAPSRIGRCYEDPMGVRSRRLIGAALLLSLITAIGTGFTPDARAAGIREEFAQALISSSRSPEISAKEDIYAGLIGQWDVEVRDHLADGSIRSAKGEWLFVRVLEGRAVQDIWISPRRSERIAATERVGNRYGSSVRTFDPNTRSWQVTWFNPVSGAFDVLRSRLADGKLIQQGRRPDGQEIRWTFLDITDSTFHWTGEALQPNGKWQLEAEFLARRHHRTY